MVEFGHKLDEKMKAMKSEIKKNVQGTNSDGKQTQTQINDLEQKEERNIQQDHNEETRIQKNGERSLLGLLAKIKCSICSYQFKKWGETSEPPGQLQMFQHLNHRGARREEEEQEIGNLLEQIMKENFLNLAKSRKLRDSQRSWTQGSTHQGTS